MANKSMTNVAYDIISSRAKPIPFAKLWASVCKQTNVNADMIGQFFNDLSLDPRFVMLKDNKWDLKSRRTFDESHVDVSEYEIDDEEENEDNNEEQEEEDLPMNNEDEY